MGAPILSNAQTFPDAGALQQQIERERQMQLPKRMAPAVPVAPTAMKPISGITVTVREFRFAGNTLITAAQLAPGVAQYLNRPLDFTELQAAVSAVAEIYRAAGWVVRVYLPEQDIKEGIVTIQIVEAVFGKLKSQDAMSQRVAPERVTALFTHWQQGGEPLNADALDRAMMLAADLPGVTVTGSLVAGASERETDLILKTTDKPLISGDASIDNTGSRSTGSGRLTANLNLASPFGIGDLLSGNVIHTQGSDYFRLGYTLPVGNDGWRVGINTSSLDYRLVASEFAGLNAHGTSNTIGLEASYPIIRSRLTNLYLNLNHDQKHFDNASGGATTTRYGVDATSVALNGNLFDNWGGGGANSASLAWVFGQRHNDVGTSNQSFSKLRYNLSRQQVITNNLSLFAQISGQESADKLDSSEKFYLGGTNGVRAYPSNEAGGSSGMFGNVELRWKLPRGFNLTGFYDHGHVRNSDGSRSYGLSGYGLSLGWQTPVGVNLKATWSDRLGDNPNPTAAGKDQDGSLTKNRFWLSASLPF